MKKGFTLVEMLIVVVVLVTLMAVTFRLSSIGDDQTRRSATISRLQRLENCLSGYYAAFGTYPPVKDHGYKNYRKVNSHGFQMDEEGVLSLGWWTDSGSHGIGSTAEYADWKIVRAVCYNQPVGCRFPYPDNYNELIKANVQLAQSRIADGTDTNTDSDHLQEVGAGWDDGYTDSPGRHDLNASSWNECQLFQFGLMSHLLPRFLMMMCSGENALQFYTQGRQWLDNNTLPCRPSTGERDWNWSQIKTAMTGVTKGASATSDKNIYWELSMVPSQSVCVRWLPNLESSCYTTVDFRLYGIDIADSSQSLSSVFGSSFAPGGADASGFSQQYTLATVTMTDGWYNEFYYYSPPPYQTYTLWSAGPNGRTFPPWISRENLDAMQNRCVGAWIEDDIINMSH